MASNAASLKTKGSINLCCVQWKAKLTKTEEKRNALRQGVEILKGQIDRLLLENANLKTACEEERTRLNAVEEEKQKETSCRISIEKEIAALKSEISSTKHEVASGHADSNEEVTHLQACISEREVEIDHLKHLLDAEKMAVELAKKNGTELQKSLENEKCKAGEANKLAAAASRVAEDCRNQLETLKSEAEKTKLMLDEVSIKFEAEKQNAIKEKSCNEKRIQEEELCANTLQKQLEEEKQKVEKLQKEMQEIMSSKKPADSRELDEVKRKLEAEKKKVAKEKKRVEEEKARVVEKRMVAEVNEKKAAEEKCRAEKLLMQLEEEKQKIGNYQREMQDLLLSHKAVNLSQLDELTKNLEEEKKKVSQVQTQVEEEKVHVMEQRRIAEANEKRVAEEKCRADKLLLQLEEEKQKIEKYEREKQELLLSHDAIYSSELDELKKNLEEEKKFFFQLQRQVDEEKASVMEQRMIVEANEKKVAEEKSHAGKLQMQLEEEKQKMEKYQMEMQDVLLSHKTVKSSELEEIKRILEEEKKKVAQAQRHVEEGNARVAEQRRIAEANENRFSEEKCRADKLLLQFEEEKVLNLQGELQKVSSSQKSAHASEAADVYRKLKAEKKKVAKESKRADLEMSRKEELKKLAEISIKNAMEEKSRADKLFEELGSSRETIDKLERELNKVNDVLEAVRKEVASDKMCEDVQMIKSDERGKVAVENEMRSMEKCQGDNLLKELEVSRQKLRITEHELQEVKLSRGSPAFVVDEQAARISLLQEQLKFEKKRVKHAKEVSKLDKGRNKILQQELQRLKQDLQCLLDHLSMLSYNFGGRSGVTSLPKKSGQSQIHFYGDKELRMSTLSSRDASCLFKQNMHVGQAGLRMESTSGMENELDPLQGGSRGDNIPSYALNSNTASFSDEQLMGSQERVAGPHTMTAGLSAENTDQQAMTLKCSNECYKQKSVEKAGIAGEHIIKSPVETGVGRTKKRRKIFDEFESIKYMHFEGKRIFEEAEKKMFSLQNTLLRPMLNERKEKESLLLPTNNITNLSGNFGESGKKKKPLCEPQILQQANDSNEHILVDEVIDPSTTETKENSQSLFALDRDGVKEVQGALKSFEQLINGDYMKLLDLDDLVAEECFRMAMERPLSPILPEFDLHDFGQKVGTQTPTVSTSGNEAVHQHQFSVHDKNQLYLVLFSDMEVGSITRILGATKTCVCRCLFLQKDWSVHHMLEALMLEKDLSSREKACVLFSLMLLNFSAVSSFKLVDFHSKELMDSFSAHIHTVLFDHDARVLCAKVCDLHDLLSLSDDLITNRKILSNNDLAYESVTGCDLSIEIMHEGELIVLRPMMASTTLVVAATVVLASICKAVGHIGLVCEISLKILQMGRAEYSLALTVLHGFADICGEEYITNCNFSLVMKVVKSVVTFMEGTLAKNANKDLQPGDSNTQHQFTQCVRCPFSEATVSLDDISSYLLAELQRHVPQNQAVLAHSLNSEVLSFVLGDVLSSLELIASIMCWDWVCNKVIPKLYKMLESSHQENRVFCTALIVLLGFIGRLGVEARGYDDAGVKGIKHQLSCLLHQTSVAKYDLTLSMVIVYELIGLYSKGHEMFQKGNYVELLSEDGHSPSSSSIVSKFLSSLSNEQITSLSGLMKPITGLHA